MTLDLGRSSDFSIFGGQNGIKIALVSLLCCVSLFLEWQTKMSWKTLRSRDRISTKRLSSTMLPLVTLLSPWTIQSTMTTLLIQLQHLSKSLWGYHQGRSKLLESATEVLQNRVQSQRAYQMHRYNVFLPHNHTNKTKAILLIPGALISHTAYSEVASRLSNQGLVVMVVSMEPFWLAYRHLGADVRSMNRIMSQIERQLLLVRGESGTDLSIYNKDDTQQILLVQATEDTLLPMTQQWQADMDAKFPTQQTRMEWILGGTHHEQNLPPTDESWSTVAE